MMWSNSPLFAGGQVAVDTHASSRPEQGARSSTQGDAAEDTPLRMSGLGYVEIHLFDGRHDSRKTWPIVFCNHLVHSLVDLHGVRLPAASVARINSVRHRNVALPMYSALI